MMFLLVAAGAVMARCGILRPEGKAVLTDAVISFILPCNIINSFRVAFDPGIIRKFAAVLAVSLVMQAISYMLSKLLYRKCPFEVRRVMQYCTIVSNSGFLGLPIAEGMFGAEGMMYASIYIIPMRIMMWSAGIACFTESPDMKSVIKKLAVHPCIVAVYIGLGLMVFEAPFSAWIAGVKSLGGLGAAAAILAAALDRAVRSAGGCTTALTMLLIGMMLADVSPKSMIDKDALFISALRLLVMPALALAVCTLARVSPFLTGVSVVMAGMPAGSTSAILAAKYGCDYTFATKCIVVSTLLSMLTLPLWGMAVG